MNQNYVIYLVHGTFAHNADWIQKDSDFSEELRKGIDAKIEVVPFNWDGKNSFKSRALAGEMFVETVQNYTNEFPDAKHVAIGHSHGGNVILYSLKSKYEIEFDKIVSMGTPFFVVKEKKYKILHSLGEMLFVFVFTFLPSMLLTGRVLMHEFLWLGLIIGPFFLAICILTLLKKNIIKKMNKVIDMVSYPDSISCSILNIQYNIDEARWWLKFLSIIADIPKLTVVMTNLSLNIGKIYKYVIPPIMVVIIILMLMNGTTNLEIVVGYKLGIVLFVLFGILTTPLLMILITSFLYPVIIGVNLLKYHKYGFSTTTIFESLFIHLKISKHPNIKQDDIELWEEKIDSKAKGWHHSHFYLDTRVIYKIKNYIFK